MAASGKGSGVPATPQPGKGGSGKGRQTTVMPYNNPNSLFQSAQAQGLQNLYRPFGYQTQGNPIPPLYGGGNPVAAAQARQAQQGGLARQNRVEQKFQPNFLFRRDS